MNELATTTNSGLTHYRQATDVAGACRDIVVKTAQQIGGRKYVRVEGWQALATAHGCVASARDVERIEGGFRAIGEVRRMDTGATISTAEGFVGDDEPTWAKRPEYARRAMAQTRAISRACRSAFAHVIVLMDAGLSTTPAEEVPAEGFVDEPHAPAPAVKHARARVIEQEPAPAPAPEPARKKQQPAQPLHGADYETLVFIKSAKKEGVSAKGKAWTRWGLYAERNGQPVWVNTFDAAFGEIIESAAQGDKLLAELKDGERGGDILDLRTEDVPPAPAVAEEDKDFIPF
jgi:hypothetical protein